jgi:hypothetical protein
VALYCAHRESIVDTGLTLQVENATRQ